MEKECAVLKHIQEILKKHLDTEENQHHQNCGHTKIIIGGLYSRWHAAHYLSFGFYKLKTHNKATGYCKLQSDCGYNILISETELSNWHLVKMC